MKPSVLPKKTEFYFALPGYGGTFVTGLFLFFAALALPEVVAQPRTDSLLRRLDTASLPAEERIHILVQLYERTAPHPEATKYIETAFALARQAGDSAALINTAKLRGFAYMDAGAYGLAVKQLKQALAWARAANSRVQVKSILNSLGISFGELSMYDSALTYHFASLKLREEMGDSRAVFVALNNIGVIYIQLNVPSEALRYLLAARSLAEQNRFAPGVELSFNLGSTHEKAARYADAIRFTQEGLAACGAACEGGLLSRANVVLAKSYFGLEQPAEARTYAARAIDAATGRSDFYTVAVMEVLLARIQIRENDYAGAIRMLQNTNSRWGGRVSPALRADIFWALHQAYEANNNPVQSSLHLKKYLMLNDSIAHFQLATTLSKIQAQFEERANLKTIREQAEILRLKEEVIYRQRQQTAFITVIACLGAALTYLLFRFSRALQIKRTDLSVKNRQLTEAQQALRKIAFELDQLVEERTKDLADANRALASTNEDLDHFIYKTSHDIRGPLATLIGLAKVGTLEVQEPTAKNYLGQIDGTASRLSHVVGKLSVINQINRNALDPVAIEPTDLVSELFQRHAGALPPGTVRTTLVVEPGVSLVSDKGLLEICLDNLISNAVKYRAESLRIAPYVEVHVEQKLQVVRFRVTDNGIGLAPLAPGQLFRMFVRASERSQTGGVGLYLAKLSATRIFGKLHHSRTADGRTVFSLLVPNDLRLRIRQAEALREEKKRQEEQVRARVHAMAQEVL